MSRSGYTEDCDGAELALYRGRVASAMRGKRGQRLLRDFVAALDAMPEKRLGAGAIKDETGCMCSLGVVADARGLDMSDVSFDDYGYSAGTGLSKKQFAERFDVAECMANEIMFENDDPWYCRNDSAETPEHRWSRMRAWAVSHITGAAIPEEGE